MPQEIISSRKQRIGSMTASIVATSEMFRRVASAVHRFPLPQMWNTKFSFVIASILFDSSMHHLMKHANRNLPGSS